MCLYGDFKLTQKFLKENKNKKNITVYKVFAKIFDYKKKPGVYSLVYNKKWHRGINKSNSKRKILPIQEDELVSRGIHVYLNKEDAIRVASYSSIRFIVEMKASLKDLIAVEGDSTLGEFREATFTKVDIGPEFKIISS